MTDNDDGIEVRIGHHFTVEPTYVAVINNVEEPEGASTMTEEQAQAFEVARASATDAKEKGEEYETARHAFFLARERSEAADFKARENRRVFVKLLGLE